MDEQTLILSLTILAVFVTFALYFWRAKRQVDYENDERWKYVLLKSKNIADISNWILVLILAVLISIPSIQNTMFPLKRVILVGILYFGLRNFLELVGLVYYNHKL